MDTPNYDDTSYVHCRLRIDPTWTLFGAWGDGVVPWGASDGPTTVLNVPFVDLEAGFSESYSPTYADTQIVGRAESYQTYMGAGSKEVELKFVFHAFAEEDLYRSVIYPSRWLELLKNPVPTGQYSATAPPPLILTIGQLFAGRVIMTSGDILWTGPFEPATMLSHGSEVSCRFTVVRRWSNSLDNNSEEGTVRGNTFITYNTKAQKTTKTSGSK